MIRRTLLLLLASAVLVMPQVEAGGRRMGDMPAPRLVLPSDETSLNGKNELEFRWGPEGGNFDHYDFRLYKGPETYEKGLILQKDVPKGANSISLDASQFESGQTYAWSLRYVGRTKSRSSYSVFSIKK